MASVAWEIRSSGMERPALFSRPSHMTVLKKGRFAVGSGRRKRERSLGFAWLYGSSTSASTNSALAGIGRPTRIRPLVSSMLLAFRRSRIVATAASGEFVPSFERNNGSRPPVASKTSWIESGVIDQPNFGWWQVWHVRPFVPKLWKKGLCRSILPVVEKVLNAPLSSWKFCS